MEDYLLYGILLTVRLASAFFFLPGYIHPDEFFQSAEIVAGDIFHADVYYPWEFNRTNPIRSAAFPYVTCGIPFLVLKWLSRLSDRLFGRPLLTNYALVVAPRVMVAALSVLLDRFLWKACALFRRDPWKPLLVLSTSYVTFTYHDRPFSNTVESVLFAALLYHVLKALREVNVVSSAVQSVGVDFRCGNLSCHRIAVLVVAGVFNRPTFALFVLAPVLFWAQYGLHPLGANCVRVAFRVASLFAGAYFTALAFVVWDSLYYGHVTLDSVLDAKTVFLNHERLVWTPVNFVRYNVNPDNLARHGLHPLWLHGILHLPMLFLNLALVGLLGYWKMILSFARLADGGGRRKQIDPVEATMTCSFIAPVLLLSLFPHQEPRFLTPLLFPLVFLYGSKVWEAAAGSFPVSRAAWLLLNALLLVFYALLHQGGLIPALNHIVGLVEASPDTQRLQLVFFHTYMPPRHLVTVPLSDREVAFHDLAGANFKSLNNELGEMDLERGWTLLFSPITSEELFEGLEPRFVTKVVRQFRPHFSAEDVPVMEGNAYSLSAITDYFQKFALNLYNVTLCK